MDEEIAMFERKKIIIQKQKKLAELRYEVLSFSQVNVKTEKEAGPKNDQIISMLESSDGADDKL